MFRIAATPLGLEQNSDEPAIIRGARATFSTSLLRDSEILSRRSHRRARARAHQCHHAAPLALVHALTPQQRPQPGEKYPTRYLTRVRAPAERPVPLVPHIPLVYYGPVEYVVEDPCATMTIDSIGIYVSISRDHTGAQSFRYSIDIEF